jgi:hypothetical protein
LELGRQSAVKGKLLFKENPPLSCAEDARKFKRRSAKVWGKESPCFKPVYKEVNHGFSYLQQYLFSGGSK